MKLQLGCMIQQVFTKHFYINLNWHTFFVEINLSLNGALNLPAAGEDGLNIRVPLDGTVYNLETGKVQALTVSQQYRQLPRNGNLSSVLISQWYCNSSAYDIGYHTASFCMPH